jgi:hypothetical protein
MSEDSSMEAILSEEDWFQYLLEYLPQIEFVFADSDLTATFAVERRGGLKRRISSETA